MKEKNWDQPKILSNLEILVKRVWVNKFQLYMFAMQLKGKYRLFEWDNWK